MSGAVPGAGREHDGNVAAGGADERLVVPRGRRSTGLSAGWSRQGPAEFLSRFTTSAVLTPGTGPGQDSAN